MSLVEVGGGIKDAPTLLGDRGSWLLIANKEVILLQELRCSSCGRLLGKAIIHNGYLEVKCTRCGLENRYKWFGNDFNFEWDKEEQSLQASGHSLSASNSMKER